MYDDLLCEDLYIYIYIHMVTPPPRAYLSSLLVEGVKVCLDLAQKLLKMKALRPAHAKHISRPSLFGSLGICVLYLFSHISAKTYLGMSYYQNLCAKAK